MKNNVKSAKTSELHEKSTPPKKLRTDLTKCPQILPMKMDAAHRKSVNGPLFFFIYFGYTFEHSMVYILSLNKDTRYQKLKFVGITKKRTRGAVTWHLRFGLIVANFVILRG